MIQNRFLAGVVLLIILVLALPLVLFDRLKTLSTHK